MKKFLATTLFVFGTFMLVSCGGSSSSGKTYCEDDEMDGCKFSACANEKGEAWYEVDGRKIKCDGADCGAAATELLQVCGIL